MTAYKGGSSNYLVLGVLALLGMSMLGGVAVFDTAGVRIKRGATVETPPVGVVALGAESDGTLYVKDSSNNDTPLGGGGSDPTNVVWVDQAATGGDGSVGSPWTGWDTAITWAEKTEYRFPKGYYSYAISPNFLLTGIALIGEAGTVLKYTGSGDAVTFSAGASTWVFDVRMENFIVEGNATADNGLVLQGVRGGHFKKIEIREFTESAIVSRACVCNTFIDLYIPREAYVTTVPKNGILLDARASDGNQTTVWNFLNAVVEGATEKGIYIKNSFWNNFYGGTAEGLDGKGLVIDANGAGVNNDGNLFIGFDFELNGTSPNVEVRGNSNHFLNCNFTGLLQFYPGKRNGSRGGGAADVTIDSGATSAFVEDMELTGTFTDNGSFTRTSGLITAASAGLPVVEKAPPNSPTFYNPSISAGSYATNCQFGNYFYFVASENFTLSDPTNGRNGHRIVWRIQQDGTGGRTITLGSKFRVGPHNVILSTTPTATDYLIANYNSSDDKWDVEAFIRSDSVQYASATALCWNNDTGLARSSAAITKFTAGLTGNGGFLAQLASKVDGSTDAVQFVVEGNATQTSDLVRFQNSAGTYSFRFGLHSMGVGSGDIRTEIHGSNGVGLFSTGKVTWAPAGPYSSLGDVFNVADTGLSRSDAGLVKFNNGSTGDGGWQSFGARLDGTGAGWSPAAGNGVATHLTLQEGINGGAGVDGTNGADFNINGGNGGDAGSGNQSGGRGTRISIFGGTGGTRTGSGTAGEGGYIKLTPGPSQHSSARDGAIWMDFSQHDQSGANLVIGNSATHTASNVGRMNVLMDNTGTAPGSSVANAAWMYVADRASGTDQAQHHFRDESGAIVSLGKLTNYWKGSDVASATSIAPTGNVHHVTGTTTVQTITSTNIIAGTVLFLIFDGSCTVNNSGNIKPAGGSFSATADDVLQIVYDGTNWYEVSRSVN